MTQNMCLISRSADDKCSAESTTTITTAEAHKRHDEWVIESQILFYKIDKPIGAINGFSTTICSKLITNSFHSFSHFSLILRNQHMQVTFSSSLVSHTAYGGFPRDVACRGELPTTHDSVNLFHHLHSLPISMIKQGTCLIFLLALDLLLVLTHD